MEHKETLPKKFFQVLLAFNRAQMMERDASIDPAASLAKAPAQYPAHMQQAFSELEEFLGMIYEFYPEVTRKSVTDLVDRESGGIFLNLHSQTVTLPQELSRDDIEANSALARSLLRIKYRALQTVAVENRNLADMAKVTTLWASLISQPSIKGEQEALTAFDEEFVHIGGPYTTAE